MLKKATALYVDGFKNLTLGRVLWKIVLLKLFVIFVVLKYGIYGSSLADMGGKQSSFVLDNLTKDSLSHPTTHSRPATQSTLQATQSAQALDSQSTSQATSQSAHATPHAQQSTQSQESAPDSQLHNLTSRSAYGNNE